MLQATSIYARPPFATYLATRLTPPVLRNDIYASSSKRSLRVRRILDAVLVRRSISRELALYDCGIDGGFMASRNGQIRHFSAQARCMVVRAIHGGQNAAIY